jgi:cytochrome P450
VIGYFPNTNHQSQKIMSVVEITTNIKTAPGPSGAALVKALVGFLRDPVKMFSEAAAAYGPVMRMKVGPYHLHQIVHPDHIYHVLHSKKYEMSAAFGPSQAILGSGLSTNSGDSWLRRRRMMQPAFHHRQIALFADTIVRETAVTIESWRDAARQGNVINVSQELLPLNLKILGQILFSADFSDQTRPLLQSFKTARRYIERSMRRLIPIPQSWPTPGNRRFFEDIERINAFTFKLIATRRQETADYPDLLNMLLRAQDRTTGEGMTDNELRDELMTILFAAREDPENALSWSLYLLGQHPQESQKLQKEVRTVLNGRPPTFEDLPNLPYLDQVVQESLRLFPPTWSLLRDVQEADEIGGYDIPEDSMVLLNIYQAHRLPQFWPEPERFNPDRFLPEASQEWPRHAYLPFGFGPRQCIGRDLAMLVIRLVLAMIVQHYEFKLAPGFAMERDAQLTLGPKNGVSMVLNETA